LAYAELSKQQLAVTRMLHNRVDRMPSLHHLALGLLALAATPVSAGVAHDICADFNTADMDPALSIYNTNGLCFTTCKDNYAYAITQYQSCWCSNYAPAKSVQVERGKCNTPCPAYPDEEQCGGQGLFGYIALANPPEGTRGPDSPSQTKESTSTSKSTTSKSADTEESSTAPAALTTSFVATVTLDGSIKTVTVAPPQTSSSNSDEQSEDEDKNKDNTSNGSTKKDGLGGGAIAGIVIGVVALILIAVGLGVFFFLRRRKQNQEQQGYQNDPSMRGVSPGTTGTGNNANMVGGGPLSRTNTSGNRSSMLVDPRMDPFRGPGLYARSGSRESINTLRDDQDYSRRIQQPLRATNPDPDVD
jgi:cell wall integrity and stress response component